LKWKKCDFGKPKVKFVRHMIGTGEIALVQSKVEAIKLMPAPTTKKLLKSFFAMCNYYRAFIPFFSDIALPLTKFTKGVKTSKIEFAEEETVAFNRLKEKLCSSELLATPRYDRPFVIQSDASDYAIGSCLIQLDDDGRKRPVAYASCKLTDVQQRWSVIKRESYDIVYALRQFDVIIYNCDITVETDYDPLIYMLNSLPKSAK